MIDWNSVLDEINVPYWNSGKNVIPGATCIQCPCCDDHSHHGNFLPDGGYKCWRCKGSAPANVIAMLGHLAVKDAQNLINQHISTDHSVSTVSNTVYNYAKSVNVPGIKRPLPIHVKYLKKRGLDWQELQEKFGIKFTGMGQRAGNMDISFRIVIPVMNIKGKVIGWQARDVTGRSPLRYVFPKVEDCLEHYKHELYGSHIAKRSERIIVVEGIFDQWKLALAGIPAVCTFGTSTTEEQVALMAGWKNIVIAFDGEPAAQQHADEIAIKLASLGRNVFIADTDFGKNPDGSARDFGDLSKEEITEYAKEIGF